MALKPDLTDDVTVHTERKDGTLYVLLVDEIDEATLKRHAESIAAMLDDADAVEELKGDLVERALREALQAEAPGAFDPATPTTVNIKTDRDVGLGLT